MKFGRLIMVAGAAALTSGCSGFLPEGGPSQQAAQQTAAMQLGSPQEQSTLPFVLISPTIDLAMALPGEPDRYGAVPRQARQEVRARVGDVLLVTIFEAGSGGLFTQPQASGNSGGGGNYVNLPAQAIDVNGNISVPYAGTVRAIGRPLEAVAREIEAKLKDRAIEPQVVITFSDERASTVSVLGQVNQGGQFPVRNTQMRILDAIAKAGGASNTSRGAEVVLQRGSHSSRVSMRRLVMDAAANVPVLPGDTIYVQPISHAVNVLGATGENARVEIDVDNMTVTDAIGRAKGFGDTRSDAGSVFVLRMEDRRFIPADTDNLAQFGGPRVPAVYQLRYDIPGGIFIGNHFRVRDGDVLYVSNASGVQLKKLLELINMITRSVNDIRSTTTTRN